MEVWLTTKDNPFDPFEEPDDWRRFDEDHGYFTLSLLARLDRSSDEESEQEQNQGWEDAIDDVMKYIDYGIYEKVTRD